MVAANRPSPVRRCCNSGSVLRRIEEAARRRWLLLPYSALLVLDMTVLFTLSMPSVALYAKRSSIEETRDFIILELSGGAVSSRVYCDRVGECRGFVDNLDYAHNKRS